jgi:hypothetical protein
LLIQVKKRGVPDIIGSRSGRLALQKSLKRLDDRHCKWLSVTENSGEYRIRRGERRTALLAKRDEVV